MLTTQHFSILWGRREIKNLQLSVYIASACKQLKSLSIKPCDRVAICAENSVEYIILLLALWKMRVIACPISPRFPDKTINAYVAKINACRLLRCVDIKRLVVFDARQTATATDSLTFDLEQEVTILSTSGSSGETKAVIHTWGNHYYSALGSNEVIPLRASDGWLLSLPLYHVSGMSILVRCLLAKAALGIDTHHDLSSAMSHPRLTHMSLVSAQMGQLLSDPACYARLREFKCILLGGSAIPPFLLEQSTQLGLNMYISYGLTEMSSQVATGKIIKGNQVCVKVLPYRNLCIAPSGEIFVKGEVLCKGYAVGHKYHLPLESYRNERWFATGDRGELNPEGCLRVTGRRDNMFISGGENIHPEEIERLLLGIKGIMEAVVVPREDGAFGFRPVAFIKWNGSPLPHDDLMGRLKADLPRFKIPVAFYPWPQDLMTQGIKVSRQEFLKALP